MDKNALALFDFDGTITRKDTLAEFIKFSKGKSYYFFGLILLSPVILSYKMGAVPAQRAKEILLSFFFKNLTEEEFEELGYLFSVKVLPRIIRRRALDKIKWHNNRQHTSVIVTASPKLWIVGWAKKWGMNIISSELEFIDGKFSGKLKGKNCSGEEKVRLIKENYDIENFKKVYAYGDSSSDKPMLGLSTEGLYKPFRK